MIAKTINIIGYASGEGGPSRDPAKAPVFLKDSSILKNQTQHNHITLNWQAIISPDQLKSKQENIFSLCTQLASLVATNVEKNIKFCVIGGDHSAAIGTWSGVYHALHKKGDIGLIWIDAHMDSHTENTTPSGNIHGMPLASLLGHGNLQLKSILNAAPKLKPENLCLIGVRSFESEEKNLLEQLKVRIYYVDEVKQKGLNTVLEEALGIVKRNTIGFGVSLDLDAIDPSEAPGVDVPEANGIKSKELLSTLADVVRDKKYLGIEIVEFSPPKDKDHKTENVIADLFSII